MRKGLHEVDVVIDRNRTSASIKVESILRLEEGSHSLPVLSSQSACLRPRGL